MSMGLIDLHHAAIRTADLAATEHFYVDVLGMTRVQRPPMNFPGTWLAIGSTMIHLMGGRRATDATGVVPSGSGAIDHLALRARGFEEYRRRLKLHGVEYRESALAEAGLKQLFVRDPNGILIELNFDAGDEADAD
jgi:catechol 2,3-dioxygenase-like lactoylglutathione lyase family enzyme